MPVEAHPSPQGGEGGVDGHFEDEALEEAPETDEPASPDWLARNGGIRARTGDGAGSVASTGRSGWYDPNNVNATGPRRAGLELPPVVARVDGPGREGAPEIRLFLLTPWMTRLLSVLRVLLLGTLATVVVMWARRAS